MFKLNDNWQNEDGTRCYKPFISPLFISDIENVDIECMKCNRTFNIKLSVSWRSSNCPRCNCLHNAFINDGVIMIDAVTKVVNTEHAEETYWFKERYKLSFVRWSDV